MRIYAHRGVSSAFPENTLAAFHAALQLPIDGIELDIHLASDGVPVVIHDERLERTTSGNGAVAQLTSTQLALLDAGGGEGVPTLAQVLDLVANRLALDLEIKGSGCESAVLELLARRPGVRAAISSFDWSILAEVRRRSADTEIWVLSEQLTDEAIETALQLRSTTLSLESSTISSSDVIRATDLGLQVMAWTVNDPHEAVRLREIGVTSLCTDDPVRICDALTNTEPS